jgi:tetratricopeptide (TPR) repeat protein
MLHDETEGNPFFMGQVLRHLVETGAIVEQDGRWVRGVDADEIGIPEGVREVVGRRLARLETATNEVLAAAAVIGREFDRDILTATVNADDEAVLDALEEAEEAHLIAGGEGHAGRYAFVHALVRSTLYDEIPTTRRLRLHRRIGDALEKRDVDAHLDQLAYHFAEAAALGETAKAVEYGRRAAEHASARLAYEEAVGHSERALGTLDPESPTDRVMRSELLVELGLALWTTGERARAREHLDAAATLAREVGRPDLLARAAIIRGGVRAWSEAGVVDDGLIGLFDEALTRYPEGDSPLRAMMTARMASELYFRPGAIERRRELTDAAVAMARRLDDPKTLAYVLNAAHWGLFEPGSERDRLAMAREMLDLTTASGDRGLEASSRSWLVSDLFATGDVVDAIAEAERELALAQELRQPDLLWAALVKHAAIAAFQGRLDDADRLGEQALAAGQQAQIETALQMYGVLQLALRRMRGGLEETIDVIAAMVEQYPLVPAWRSALAYVYRELGRLDEAREPFEVTAADDFAMLPRDGNWMVGIAISAVVCSSLGDTERAAWLYREYVPFEDAVVLAGIPADVVGSAHHFLMLLAATLERWDDFERHAREALARNDAMRSPPWTSTTRFELATILTRRGRAGDAERARQLLAECLETCDALDFPYLAARARVVLEEVGSGA